MLEEEEETRREGKRINVIDPPKTWREKFRSNCTLAGGQHIMIKPGLQYAIEKAKEKGGSRWAK